MYSPRLGRSFVAVLLAAACSMVLAGTASAVSVKCKAAIIKASATFAQAKTKALQKCEEAVVKGKLPQSTDCSGEAKASAAIAKAAAKLTTTIDKACGGADKVCGGDTTDEDGGTAIGFPATCPNFENGTCTNAVGTTNCTGIATCLLCIDEAAVDQAIGLSYDALVTTDPKGQKVLNKCQVAIGKAAAAFFNAKSKILSKCQGAVNKTGTGSCPGAAEAPKIAAAAGKVSSGILKACAGKNKAIGGSGVDADFTPGDIGFPATCNAVDPPGAEPACNGAIANLQNLIDCVACVNEFKVDCADAIGAATLAAYPSQCNPGPGVTPTPMATPGICGDNNVQLGEFCDGNGPGGACGPAFPCNGACTCACPSKVHFAGDPTDPATILDTGFSGIAHRAPVIANGDVTVTLSCTPPNRPCGVCTVSGPIANVGSSQLRNQRCTSDTSVKCTNAPGGTGGPCAGLGTCEFYFGAPLPLVAGGVGTCVTNQFKGAISGTANVESGEAATTVNLISRVHASEISTDTPCPVCVGDATLNDDVKGGTCMAGLRPGLTCDGNGTVPGRADFGTTSFDCPPPAATIAVLPIDLTNSTGSVSKTLSASSPTCGDSTLPPGTKCVCDTCNNINAEPCDSNLDCPPTVLGAGVCRGLRCIGGSNDGGPCSGAGGASQCPAGGACGRPGEATKPNGCVGAPCADMAPVGDNAGVCPDGPANQTCSVASGHPQRSCTNASACCDDAPACVTDPVTPGDCVTNTRSCFLDNGIVGGAITGTGMADPPVEDTSDPILAAVFCIAPTSAPAVNIAAGLPGPGRVTIKGTAKGLP